MFIDASALTALLAGEVDAQELLARLERSKIRLTSPLAAWEAAVAIRRIIHLTADVAAQGVEDYLELMEIEVVSIVPEIWKGALAAHDRFGKGKHPARLNFGDCFAYACARHYKQPLMFKGGDFALTDIEAA